MNFIRFASLYFSCCLCFYIISSTIWLMITLLCATTKRLNLCLSISTGSQSTVWVFSSNLNLSFKLLEEYVFWRKWCLSKLLETLKRNNSFRTNNFGLLYFYKFGTLRTGDYVLPYLVRGLLPLKAQSAYCVYSSSVKPNIKYHKDDTTTNYVIAPP